MDFEVGFYSHPIFSKTGGFPERLIKRIAEKSAEQGFPRSRLPELSQDEINFIRGKDYWKKRKLAFWSDEYVY